MKKEKTFVALLFSSMIMASCNQSSAKTDQTTISNKEITSEELSIKTPDDALTELKNGNARFLNGKFINTNYQADIEKTKTDQNPHSLILSCLDSRIPPEIIFDQGIGNIFVARVAGNIEDPNILGSMEFATKVKNTKLIVVMGHNKCGAVKGAIDNAVLGNLTQLVSQIKPAISGDKTNMDDMIDKTSHKNVELTIADIQKQSTVLSDLVKEGKLKIIGAFYDLTTGKVTFMD